MDINLQLLLNGLTETSKAFLLQRLLAMSKFEAGLWSLTLKSVMIASTRDESHVLVDLMMSDDLGHSEQSLQTLQCLIGAESSIYNLKVTVENYSKMLCGIDTSNVKGRNRNPFIIAQYNVCMMIANFNSSYATDRTTMYILGICIFILRSLASYVFKYNQSYPNL